MFVGEPGVVRKSTSAGYGQRTIEAMNRNLTVTSPAYVNFGPDSGSHVAVIDKMAKVVDGSIALFTGEFGTIVSTSPEDTYVFLTKMFDSDGTAEKYEHSTRGSGNAVIKRSSLNIIGCTTPDWMLENTGYMTGGGFAARTVFIFEKKKRASHLFYKGIGPSVADLDKMEKALAKDLARIGNIKGEAVPETDELAEEMEEWYQKYDSLPPEKGGETFKARKHVHVLRTCMTLSLCERDDLIITKAHFEESKRLLTLVEKGLARGLAQIGRNPHAALLYKVLDYIEANGPVKKGIVSAYFFKDISPEGISSIYEVLKACGEIEELIAEGTLRIKKKG